MRCDTTSEYPTTLNCQAAQSAFLVSGLGWLSLPK
jgi:hypothetical protein